MGKQRKNQHETVSEPCRSLVVLDKLQQFNKNSSEEQEKEN